MLTADEHTLIDNLATIWNQFGVVVADGPSRTADLAEIAVHIHALQALVLSQSAARAHPDRYRLLGDGLGQLDHHHGRGEPLHVHETAS